MPRSGTHPVGFGARRTAAGAGGQEALDGWRWRARQCCGGHGGDGTGAQRNGEGAVTPPHNRYGAQPEPDSVNPSPFPTLPVPFAALALCLRSFDPWRSGLDLLNSGLVAGQAFRPRGPFRLFLSRLLLNSGRGTGLWAPWTSLAPWSPGPGRFLTSSI